jgi:hypothetical protein
MNPVSQGSALRRTPDPAASKIQFNGCAELRRSVRVSAPDSCARDCHPNRYTLSVLQVARRATVMQGSALWQTAPVNPVSQGSALRRAPATNPVSQGSALRRIPDPAASKIQFNGCAELRRSVRVSAPGSCARDCRPNRYTLSMLQVARRATAMQGSALWRGSPVNPALQGSAL